MAAQAELLALAERQVAEPSRPLSDRKAETVTDRLWPIVRIEHRTGKRPHEADWGASVRPGRKPLNFGLFRDF